MSDRIVGVDVGGTFTDVALLVGSELITAKVPSTEDQSEGVIAGIEKACEDAGITPDELEAFSHAMTVSVNALLEEAGAKTALVTTEGFRDVLEIGRQDRPSLYDLQADKPMPLVPRRRRYEVAERTTTGGIEQSVDEDDVRRVAKEIHQDGVEAVAVSLLHAYAHPENEQRVVQTLREELDVPVSASHEVLAEFREYERTSTTVVDAYVRPSIDRYIGHLSEKASETGVPHPRIMQANGGITDAETVRQHAVLTVLSGPAAGVVGASAMADGAVNKSKSGLVTFDMGGTSSDVSLVRDGDVERTTEGSINDRPIKTPLVDIETVGAGGGSIAWIDSGGALRIGPRSAGAEPGPACYDRGGTEPTVTDANLVLGYIGSTTSLGGELSLNEQAAHDALADLAEEGGMDGPVEAAQGVYRVANANMSRAIRSVTVERGFDPRKFGLVAFGGAGPMHAVSIADTLDMDRVVIPRASGILSAYGLLAADEKQDAVRTFRRSLDSIEPDDVDTVYSELEDDVLTEISDRARASIEYFADLRYAGQSFELTVAVGDSFDPRDAKRRFAEAHEATYGYRMDEPIHLINCRVTATVSRDEPEIEYQASGDPLKGTRDATFGDGVYETPVFHREKLSPARTIDGPAVIEQDESTIVVPPAWDIRVRDDGSLVSEVK
ncbi:hydantoinase/oxoprolinase family protein [Halocatena salina]|uniref:Hydantoinase/oxoprolinase family protein n=1 Tax=Halocatena salina TaxID=2934340 RepID=A0A8U0A744_9EURY|nr:hydantoinase/oxoprolinase family protein [Halocatena salina]UPM44679.1 hydantoinase/oxoprolinase family protein [Halocatena salina]